ncbi:hypothetical protein, partial [Sphingobium sp. LB126]
RLINVSEEEKQLAGSVSNDEEVDAM